MWITGPKLEQHGRNFDYKKNSAFFTHRKERKWLVGLFVTFLKDPPSWPKLFCLNWQSAKLFFAGTWEASWIYEAVDSALQQACRAQLLGRKMLLPVQSDRQWYQPPVPHWGISHCQNKAGCLRLITSELTDVLARVSWGKGRKMPSVGSFHLFLINILSWCNFCVSFLGGLIGKKPC